MLWGFACAPRTPTSSEVRERVASEARRAAARAEAEGASITVQAVGNQLRVDDERGRPLLLASVELVDGNLTPAGAFGRPVQLKRVKALLHQDGRPQISLEAPVATWDGKQLRAAEKARGVTPDGKTVILADSAIWTASNGRLELTTATLEEVQNGKPAFTARAPAATVMDGVATMSQGAAGQSADGRQMRADRARWHLHSGRLEASGNVTITDAETVVTGSRLVSDTRLQRGKLSGGGRLVVQRPAAGTFARRKAVP
jgi:lipopolysaccharide export system protein LptA